MLLFYNKMLDVGLTLVFKTWSNAFAATGIVRKSVGLEARYSRISVEKVKNTQNSNGTSDWCNISHHRNKYLLIHKRLNSLRNVSNIQLRNHQIRKKHITERWKLSQFSSWTSFVNFCCGTLCCFKKAELCCVVPVSLCFINWMALNQSQSGDIWCWLSDDDSTLQSVCGEWSWPWLEESVLTVSPL